MIFRVDFISQDGKLAKVLDFTVSDVDRFLHILDGYFDYAELGEKIVISVVRDE